MANNIVKMATMVALIIMLSSTAAYAAESTVDVKAIATNGGVAIADARALATNGYTASATLSVEADGNYVWCDLFVMNEVDKKTCFSV